MGSQQAKVDGISIGCRNTKPRKGMIGIDMVEPPWAEEFPDRFMKADAKALPFEDESVGYVYASHVFEHIPKYDNREAVLAEWWRVLVPGGTMKIIVPNLDSYLYQLATGRWDTQTFNDMMYGLQTNPWEVHYITYDATMLKAIVRKACKGSEVESVTFGHRGRWNIPDLEIRGIFRKREKAKKTKKG